MTVNESITASFQCSVSDNPKPVSTWSKLEGKSEKNLSATTDGKLILPNAAGSDSGVYKCSASNILGQAGALVRLVVNGKFLFVSNNTEDLKETIKLCTNSIQFIRVSICRWKRKVKAFVTCIYIRDIEFSLLDICSHNCCPKRR